MRTEVFILCHIALSGLWFFISQLTQNRKRAATEAALVFFLPGAGLLSLLIFKLVVKIFHIQAGHNPELDEREVFIPSAVKPAGNIIPLNDAFLVSDVKAKRKLFTEAIKQEIINNQSVLQLAMHDKDREIAYYAVSLLTGKMEQMETYIFKQESLLLGGHDEKNVEALKEYATLLAEYLAQKSFVDHITWRQKQLVYVGVLDRLTSLLPTEKQYFMEEITQLFSMKDYATAEKVCHNFLKNFPLNEAPYIMYIELYQKQKKLKELRQKLKELKACPISLSPRALRIIRFWDRGVLNA